VKQLQYLDAYTFMSELILPKVDRASMAHSLEVRVPFLDHQLMTFLFSLSPETYMESGVQKIFLRELLRGHVPQQILDRPKQGFVGPDQYYMDYALYRDVLKNGRLVNEGVIRSEYVETLVSRKDHWRLWKLFVLENWWETWT
jgi:asparagine synthase (glutamine-hydrolysing)